MKNLSKEMEALLVKQIGVEYSNCVAYWALEWAMLEQAFSGFARWMHEAASDERHHAKKIAYYLIDRGKQPPIEVADNKPAIPYGSSPQDIFNAAYELERKTTAAIEALVTQAEDDEDPETWDFLAWYVDEQVDSEKELMKILKRLKKAGTDYAALMHLDHKLG